MQSKIQITDVNCADGQKIINIVNAYKIRIEAIEATQYTIAGGIGIIPAGNSHVYSASPSTTITQAITFLAGICKIYQTIIYE
jgi:hypothetical protein